MTENYWSQRYREGQTGWDIGYASPAIIEFMESCDSKDLKILIPGAGNAWEAEDLFRKGFKNIFIADIAEEPLKNFKNRVPDFPDEQLLQIDYFNIEDKFDLILEQTFFCALPVALRQQYANKAASLLNNNGKIAGLLFNFELTSQGPPFGGSKEEYSGYFRPLFKINKLEACYNSIKPREGKELFFIFTKL